MDETKPYVFCGAALRGWVLAGIEKIDNLRREDEPLGEGQGNAAGWEIPNHVSLITHHS